MNPAITIPCEIDRRSIGHTAAHYLLEQDRFATFLTVTEAGCGKNPPTLHAAFAKTLRKNGFVGTIRRIVLPGIGLSSKNRRLREVLSSLERPVAVLTQNDRIALEVVAFALKDGLRVPDEIAVLGIGDNQTICDGSPVKLTSVKLACERLGHAMLCRMLDPDNAAVLPGHAVICAPIGVSERDSVRRIHPRDHYVSAAVSFIQHGEARILDVAKVVSVCGASRSYLEKRFRLETGMSILQAIHARKLRVIERNLIETSTPVALIAEEAGFTSESGLCAFFKRETGQSMSEFRNARRRPS